MVERSSSSSTSSIGTNGVVSSSSTTAAVAAAAAAVTTTSIATSTSKDVEHNNNNHHINSNNNNSNNTNTNNKNKNRIVYIPTSMIWRKTMIIICFVVVITLLLIRPPPPPSAAPATTTINVIPNNNNNENKVMVKDGMIRHAKTGFDDNNNEKKTTTTTKTKKKNPIKLIAILGERNSGTRWTFDHLTKCYNDTIEVRKGLSRYKHWFQYDNATKYPHDALVLAQFRNPYDWFKAMEHVPHHAPAHLRTKINANIHDHSANNDWKIFLTKSWTMERYGIDLNITNPYEMCQEDFYYRDIVSCVEDPIPPESYNYTLRYSENQPFYEMRNDGSGVPYNNILELRTDKIRNFLNTIQYEGVADVWSLQYEYLVSLGTQHLLDRITELTGVVANCDAIPPQIRKPKGSRMIRADFAQHIRTQLNWTVESWIGYYPELKYEQAPSQWRRRQRRRRRRYLQSLLFPPLSGQESQSDNNNDDFEWHQQPDDDDDDEYDYYEE